MKKILVTRCSECPYLRHKSGMGYGEPYEVCKDTGKIVYNDDENIDYLDTIPPWCRLSDEKRAFRKEV